MTKRVLRLWGLLLICGLVACQSAASPTLAPSPTPAPTSTSIPTSTSVPTATPGAARPTATPVEETSKEETVADTPTEPAWQIPRVGETDWTKGTAGAGLVVVEYSDFQ